ncbi:DUF5704 domain-containing protein [Paenibacillus sp. M1]|uniref:DUF5704 domain-containing protein n=1 Tax=Paenibacillus haidiansis TaxID=1574488 RepID=A0ABU7VXF8_9BACL
MWYFSKFFVDFDSYTYIYKDKLLRATFSTGVGEPEEPGGGDPGGGSGSCSIKVSSPSQTSVSAHAAMDPLATGVIQADERDNEQFDVLDGIPTSESLYVNVFGLNYLYQHEWGNMTGEVTYTVPVTKEYILKWTVPGRPSTGPDDPGTPDEPKEKRKTVRENIEVTRSYSYWQINNLEAYKVTKTEVSNYALPGEQVTITPSGYTPPTLTSDNSTNVNDHVEPARCEALDLGSETVSGGSSEPSLPNYRSEFESEAESSVGENRVKNDYVVFNGETIMSNGWVNETTPLPRTIPSPATMGRNVLYGHDYKISSTKVNKKDTATTGKIYYSLIPGNINGGSDKNFNVNGLNTVTVHTPTVIYADASDDREHNQKTEPDYNRRALILDRSFQIFMPTSGQHRNILGYGDRDYAKYIKEKQVRFPFDVYTEDKETYYFANTWITIPVHEEETTFYLPVWVDEGYYDVEFRTFAENAPSGATNQTHANTNLSHHIAYDTVPVDVIGRVYDFRVTDIADYNWETVFRTVTGSAEPTGASYWTGLNGIDGRPRGNSPLFTLPIRPGSHPLYKNAVLKTGYHFKFDLKTKGNMFGPGDSIRITPSFYFVSAKDGSRTKVDLYYQAGNRSYVKIGSSRDEVKRYVILNDRLRNVPLEELTDTALYKYDHDYTFDQVAGIGRTQFVRTYVQKMTRQKTPVGSLSLMELNARIRTLIGPKYDIPSGVNTARANAAVQKWYGEYSLPADLYAVKAGSNVAEYGRTHNGLSDKSDIFLKDGFIVVNFNIETIRNGNTGSPYLQYIEAPLVNQWVDMEGYARQVTDPYGRKLSLMDGDVVFYEADRSSRDDFRPMVTH